MPEFSSLFIGVEGLPRVFKAADAAPPIPEAPHPDDDVRREETVRVRTQLLTSGGRNLLDDDPLPDPPEFASVSPEAPTHHGPAGPNTQRHATQEFVSRGAHDSSLPAPPDFGSTREPARTAGASGAHRTLGTNPLLGGPLLGGPIAAESGALPAPPDFATRSSGSSSVDKLPDTRPRKPPPASMLEAVTKVVNNSDDEEDAPGSENSRTRSSPILVADLARAAAAHAEKTVQAVDSQRAREKAELSLRTPTASVTSSTSSGRAATAAAVTAAMEIARETSRQPASRGLGSTERAPLEPSPKVTEKFPAEPRPVGVDRAAAVVDRSAAQTAPEPSRSDPPRPEPSLVAVGAAPTEAPASVPRPPEVVIVKVAEPAKGGSGALVALLGVAAAAALVFGVPSIRERVFNLGQPTPVTKAEPTKAAAPAMPTEEFKSARAATRSLGLKETNKAQTSLQKILDDAKRSPAAVAQAKQLLAELLLTRALACQIAVALDPSAMGGEAAARGSEDPPAAKELLDSLGDAAPPDADGQRRIAALQAIVAGQSPAIPPGNDELTAIVRAAPLWRNQVKTPPSGLITSLRRLPSPSTLSQAVLALALVRSGDETGAREILLEILKVVPDQPLARTLLDVLDRQGMMNEQGDPEVNPSTDPPPVIPTPSEPRPSEPGRPRPPGVASSDAIEAMISAGCQKVRAGDPDGVKVLLDAIQRGAKPTENFNLSFCLGNGFARQNSHDTAFTWYSRAVAQSPGNRDAIAGAARSAELLGRTSVAVEYYKKLRTLEPGNAAAGAYLSKHDQPEEPTTPPPDDPGELMPIKRKGQK
jgi:tetratricopeptide (TPR) repeat protein